MTWLCCVCWVVLRGFLSINWKFGSTGDTIKMSKRDKLLQKMRSNHRDWRIDDLKIVAEHFGFKFRQPGTSHITFSNGVRRLTVPAHKPIKPLYVQRFIAMIDKSILEDIVNVDY